ncbi:MAG: acetyl-CoA carboxylase carboxyltransferase subunit alpha [Candidatus Margulisiibacteriota bacterium]|jgi:acetyl-CoA carboxylase carboxyl transferase subunit alpha
MKILDFEKPIYELYDKIDELKKLTLEGNIDITDEIIKIEKRAEFMEDEIYQNLTPNQIVQIARHPSRPDSHNLIRLISDEFQEISGDRFFRDDPSIVGGIGTIKNFNVVFIGQQKGHDTKENIYRNFGMPHPEGYRKALRLMRLAEKFGLPIITLVDTPGAYPGIGAEERGQAEAIARNLKEMTGIKTPIISIIIGEGGSGGALGLAVANKVYMLRYSIYSVISPEGCASILFRNAEKSPLAAEKLKLTADDLLKLEVTDGIIDEPFKGAHTNWDETANNIKKVILKELQKLQEYSVAKLLDERYSKFRKLGKFIEE